LSAAIRIESNWVADEVAAATAAVSTAAARVSDWGSKSTLNANELNACAITSVEAAIRSASGIQKNALNELNAEHIAGARAVASVDSAGELNERLSVGFEKSSNVELSADAELNPVLARQVSTGRSRKAVESESNEPRLFDRSLNGSWSDFSCTSNGSQDKGERTNGECSV